MSFLITAFVHFLSLCQLLFLSFPLTLIPGQAFLPPFPYSNRPVQVSHLRHFTQCPGNPHCTTLTMQPEAQNCTAGRQCVEYIYQWRSSVLACSRDPLQGPDTCTDKRERRDIAGHLVTIQRTIRPLRRTEDIVGRCLTVLLTFNVSLLPLLQQRNHYPSPSPKHRILWLRRNVSRTCLLGRKSALFKACWMQQLPTSVKSKRLTSQP